MQKRQDGITPAGAGKTGIVAHADGFAKDHPRRCGENLKRLVLLPEVLGSPPQVRGKQKTYLMQKRQDGITPAGAGKTYFTASFVPSSKDHPRRCGENLSTFRHHRKERGSPPQVRGKLSHIGFYVGTFGITPAGAGKTYTACDHPRACRDHPRRCGENNCNTASSRSGRGSPPQVRGKQLQYIFRVRSIRITPAGAGKTPAVHLWTFHPQDHPRRCGENCGCTAAYTHQ